MKTRCCIKAVLFSVSALSLMHLALAQPSYMATPVTRPESVFENDRRLPRTARSSRALHVGEGYVTTDDGVRLFYQKVGSGGPTVIVPGRLFVFDYLKPLADRYTIISYDMRNRGRSDKITDGALISIQDDVKDLEKVRQHFGIKKFDLIGYSYLGMMVILYTMEHPQQVERIVSLVQFRSYSQRNTPAI